MKKFFSFILILSVFLVSGCFGGGNEEETAETEESTGGAIVEAANRHETADFSIGIPSNWEIIKSFPKDYPAGLQVALRNNVKEDQTFIANVTVTRHDLGIPMTSIEYAHQQIFDHQNTLLNFRELSKEVITLSVDGEATEALLSVFEGKQKPEESTLKFFQTYGVKSDVAFTATCAVDRAEDEATIDTCSKTVRTLVVK